MRFEDLGAAWRRQSEPAGAAERHADELAAVRARAHQLGIVIRRRDLIETVGALLLLPIFGFFALRPGDLLVRVGSAILVLACIAIPLVLRRARRRPADHGQPVADFLRVELDLVLRQRRLLLTAPLWYLTPLGVGVILFFAGANPSPWLTAAYAAVVIVFFGAIWRLNRRVVEKELEPRARDLRLWIELTRGARGEESSDNRRGP